MSPADQDSTDSSPGADVWTIQRILTWSTGYLKEKGSDRNARSQRLEAELLLGHALGCDRVRLYVDLDKPLGRAERDVFKALLRRRIEGEPIAYLIGYRDFYKFRFKVNPSVLVPRPDTEILVESAVSELRDLKSPRVLDIGTGSGCIAISVALECPHAQMVGWDISAEALAVASENRETLKADVDFLQFDVRTLPEVQSELSQKFDVILSNPPYISISERDALSTSVRDFEPHLALFGAGDDGLEFYEIFARHLPSILNKDGCILIEMGFQQSAKVSSLFQDAGWRKISVMKDLSGHDRILRASRPL